MKCLHLVYGVVTEKVSSRIRNKIGMPLGATSILLSWSFYLGQLGKKAEYKVFKFRKEDIKPFPVLSANGNPV